MTELPDKTQAVLPQSHLQQPKQFVQQAVMLLLQIDSFGNLEQTTQQTQEL